MGLTGASTLIVKIGLSLNWWAGLTGIIPGLIGQNQCRIWIEKEQNLSRCEQGFNQEQTKELNRQKTALAEMKEKQSKIEEIVTRYDQAETSAKSDHELKIRDLIQKYIHEGKNIRDQNTQIQLKNEILSLEEALNAEIDRLKLERLQEMNALT